ncbi:MAG: hypothetical protein LBP58_03430 [Azoarcus sp.]|jgi:hypothetical protein|nr:hypothetical protein [Azoarcus sp.]
MTNDSPALALVGLSLCEAGDKLDAWSRALFLVSFLVLLLGASLGARHLAMAVACLACAGGEAFLAWRLAFDRPVFAAWARLDADRLPGAQQAFDVALEKVSKKTPGNRPLAARVAGLKRLFVRQIAAFAGQVVVLLALLETFHVR